jgi:hypothetical protein
MQVGGSMGDILRSDRVRQIRVGSFSQRRSGGAREAHLDHAPPRLPRLPGPVHGNGPQGRRLRSVQSRHGFRSASRCLTRPRPWLRTVRNTAPIPVQSTPYLYWLLPSWSVSFADPGERALLLLFGVAVLQIGFGDQGNGSDTFNLGLLAILIS